ncbi:hypothetical protein ACJJTC_002571 [Scirpophaga incertulas]
MYDCGCCRMCLNSKYLTPIFTTPEGSEKYTNAIYVATGIKIEITDNLSHQMCVMCIKFINKINEFRKNAERNQGILLKRTESQPINETKNESDTLQLKLEDGIPLAIITLDNLPNDFKDYNDDINSDGCDIDEGNCSEINLNSHIEIEKSELTNDPSKKQYEVNIKDNEKLSVAVDVNNDSKKENVKTEKIVQRKLRNRKREPVKTVKRKKMNDISDNGKEEIECKYCNKILTSKLSLRNHYKIHTGFDVVCEHCGKKFITRRLLLMHCRAKHGYEKIDKCSFCDYRASNAEQVKIHERLHTGERPYVCAECGAGFHRRSSYLQHVPIHLPEKTVQCDQCPARFKSVTLMRIHKNRHRLPAYTFRCIVCGNNFARRRNVARHLQRVHSLQPDPQHILRDKIS